MKSNLEQKVKEREAAIRDIIRVLEYIDHGGWRCTDDVYQDVNMKYNLVDQIATLEEILEDI